MRKPFIAIAIIAVAMLIPLTACDPGSDGNTAAKPSANTTVDSGVASQDATADVKIGTKLKLALISAYVDVTVTNHSEKTSDYQIRVTLNSKDGTEQLDDGVVFIDALKPGQLAKDKLVFISINKDNLPKNAVVTLELVQRTATN